MELVSTILLFGVSTSTWLLTQEILLSVSSPLLVGALLAYVTVPTIKAEIEKQRAVSNIKLVSAILTDVNSLDEQLHHIRKPFQTPGYLGFPQDVAKYCEQTENVNYSELNEFMKNRKSEEYYYNTNMLPLVKDLKRNKTEFQIMQPTQEKAVECIDHILKLIHRFNVAWQMLPTLERFRSTSEKCEYHYNSNANILFGACDKQDKFYTEFQKHRDALEGELLGAQRYYERT